jgi:hypothetical protein
MLVSRRGLVPGWIARSLLAAIGATVAATLPLGSSSALAASSNRVSASTLLSNACKATFSASAFRFQGHVTSAGTAMSVDIYLGSAGDLATVTEHGDNTVRLIKNGPSFYMEGNRAFWLSNTNNNRAAASLFAGRWIDVTADRKDLRDFLKSLNKGTVLSQCQSLGSASYAGNAVVNGTKVIKIHSYTSSESDTFYIEKGPIPYLLRVTTSQSQNDSADVVFSHYGVQPQTAAPAGAVPFSQLSGNSGNSGNS